MNTQQIIDLMLKSSEYNPYTGPLSDANKFIAAIELAKLCRDFAEKGYADEAMNIPCDQWDCVILGLKNMRDSLLS